MSTDERRYNYRKAPSLQHKIRVITGNKTNPIQWGIGLPQFIVNRFSDCSLRLFISGDAIVMESGCKLSVDDIDDEKKYCFDGMRETEAENGVMQWVK